MGLTRHVLRQQFVIRLFNRRDFMTEPTHEQILCLLKQAQAVAIRARDSGHHPFGALLVAPDHETILADQENIDTVNHAESTLARIASSKFGADYLWQCTLVTTVEPCVMCAGTLYWANIGRLIFGMTEQRLLQLTGKHVGNPTLNVPSRYVFEHGQKPISVIGPIPEVEDEIALVHKNFWSASPLYDRADVDR